MALEEEKKTSEKIFEYIQQNEGMSAFPSKVHDALDLDIKSTTVCTHIKKLKRSNKIKEVKGRYFIVR